MRIAITAPGFSPARSERQPWLYVDRLARGLLNHGFEVVVLTDCEVSGDMTRTLPFDTSVDPGVHGIRALMRGRYSENLSRLNGGIDASIRFLGWMDVAFGNGARDGNHPEIAMFASPSFAHGEWRNAAMSIDSGWQSNLYLILSHLASSAISSDQLASFDGVAAASPNVFSAVSRGRDDQAALFAPPGVDLDTLPYARTRVQEDLRRREPMVTYCGPPRRERGFRQFLDLIEIVERERRDVAFQLLLRPDSPADERRITRVLKAWRKSRGVSRVVIETSPLPRDQFLRAMSRSSVVVFPFEYLVTLTPVSPLETIAMGIPVVVTPVGDLEAYVDASRGIVVNDFRSQSLAEGLFRVLDNLDTYGGASRRASPGHRVMTWPEVVNLWAEFLGSVIARGS